MCAAGRCAVCGLGSGLLLSFPLLTNLPAHPTNQPIIFLHPHTHTTPHKCDTYMKHTIRIFRAKGVRGVYSATFKALRNLPGTLFRFFGGGDLMDPYILYMCMSKYGCMARYIIVSPSQPPLSPPSPKIHTIGMEAVIQAILSREVQGAVRRLSKSDSQIARDAEAARRPMLRLPLEGVPGDELLKQLELLKKQEESLLKGGTGRSLGYAHTHDVGGRLGEHCDVLLKTFRVRLCVCGGGGRVWGCWVVGGWVVCGGGVGWFWFVGFVVHTLT
jgi:hypothetical protein